MSALRLPRERRREVILDAAESLVARHGYALTRMQDVASASGVSKQLVQRHFASKRELLLAVLARRRDGLFARLAAPIPAPTLAESLALRTDAWFSYLEEHPAAVRLLFVDMTGDPEVALFYAEMRDAARAATADMLRAEKGVTIPAGLLMPAAEMIRAGTVGLAVWWADHPEVPRSEVVGLALKVWTGGLWAEGGGAAP